MLQVLFMVFFYESIFPMHLLHRQMVFLGATEMTAACKKKLGASKIVYVAETLLLLEIMKIKSIFALCYCLQNIKQCLQQFFSFKISIWWS